MKTMKKNIGSLVGFLVFLLLLCAGMGVWIFGGAAQNQPAP
jgi:hypothetical protein